MKRVRSILALTLALVLVLAMGTAAFAANTTEHPITIMNTQASHTYTAYQVFAGDVKTLEGKTVLTNISWGAGVDGDALLTALKKSNNDVYGACANAEDVANVLKGFTNSSTELDAFAKIVGEHLAAAAGTSTESVSPYVIKVKGDGYYFVKDTGVLGNNDAATKYILQVIEDSTIAAKVELPTIDKVIVNADSHNGGEGNGTAQDVGSDVSFKLTSKVPAMDGYTSYTYVVHDTLSDGLTFNNDVAVTIGGTTYTNFTVAQDGQSFTITFNDFINQKANAGKDIVITYSAKINEKALNRDDETNTVHLEYSNNPYDGSSTGTTPDEVVYVYDFDIVIDKYTGDEADGTRLAGAMFVLKNAEGKYYHWNAVTKAVEWVSVDAEPDTLNKSAEEIKAAWEQLGVTVATTDASGAARFSGLDVGSYSLKEIAAPAGYNLLKEEVTVTITASYNEDGTLKESSAASTDNGQYFQTEKIQNNAGTELPSTGGTGTTIFYILGSLLVVVAGVLLVTRKRMNASEN